LGADQCRRSRRAAFARLLRLGRPGAGAGRSSMAPSLDQAPSTIDRIRHDLVGLKIRRVLEALHHLVRRLEKKRARPSRQPIFFSPKSGPFVRTAASRQRSGWAAWRLSRRWPVSTSWTGADSAPNQPIPTFG